MFGVQTFTVQYSNQQCITDACFLMLGEHGLRVLRKIFGLKREDVVKQDARKHCVVWSFVTVALQQMLLGH